MQFREATAFVSVAKINDFCKFFEWITTGLWSVGKKHVHLYFYFTYNSIALVGSTFGVIWEDPEGGFIKFDVKRASKQDQTLHMEGKLCVILYFRQE